jgi:hypothetical protein
MGSLSLLTLHLLGTPLAADLRSLPLFNPLASPDALPDVFLHLSKNDKEELHVLPGSEAEETD